LLAVAALVTLLAAVVLTVEVSPHGAAKHPRSARAVHARVRKVSPYWTVRPGDTLTKISDKTGLSIAQLQAYNPNTDPHSLLPGERLNLWRHPPGPARKPPERRFWTVRAGESFGSIAAKTEINLAKLEQLNRRLKPTALQPGDRVRLRS
jgi:LysM repeat protein